ncbi:hypothetical protein SPB21_07420 [Leptothoe sp. ISB3NOV94-8A]
MTRRWLLFPALGIAKLAWLYAETQASTVQFKLYGIYPTPILLWEAPDTDLPFAAGNTVQDYSFTGSGEWTEENGRRFGTEDNELRSLITNQSWSAVASSDASFTATGDFLPNTNASAVVIVNSSNGALRLDASASEGTSGSDTENGSLSSWGHSGYLWRMGGTIGGSGSFPRTIDYTGTGSIAYTLSGDAPLTYQGHLYRDEDTLHVVINYGLKLNSAAIVSGSNVGGDQDEEQYTTVDSGYLLLDRTNVGQVGLAEQAFHGMLWRRLRHIQVSASTGAILATGDYATDNLPPKPTPLIPRGIWSDSIPRSFQWDGDNDRNIPEESTCLNVQYVFLDGTHNSRMAEWNFNYTGRNSFASIQRFGGTYYHGFISAAQLETPTLTQAQVDLFVQNNVNNFAEVNDPVTDSEGSTLCTFHSYKNRVIAGLTGQPGVSDGIITALKSSILNNSRPDRDAPGLNFRLDVVPILGLDT